MKLFSLTNINQLFCTLTISAFIAAGCAQPTDSKVTSIDKEPATTEPAKKDDHDHGAEGHDHATDDVQAAMAKLSAEDRALAEAQGFCVVGDGPLGGMGVPVKLMIEDKPVFICCEHCKEKAEKDPKATLAKVEEMKQKTAAAKSAATSAKADDAHGSEAHKDEHKDEHKKDEAHKDEAKKDAAK